MRSTTEVIQDHLARRLDGDADGDLRNYHEDVILLTGSGRYDGHDGLKASAAELKRLVGDDAATPTTRRSSPGRMRSCNGQRTTKERRASPTAQTASSSRTV